jgi:hypothetical protein
MAAFKTDTPSDADKCQLYLRDGDIVILYVRISIEPLLVRLASQLFLVDGRLYGQPLRW